jgi:anti-anti-sigma factor
VAALPRRRLTLSPETTSAGQARQWLAAQLGDESRDVVETALLLTSEVVTNAVLHARTLIDLAVEVVPGRVRVEVADRSPVLPMTKHYDTSAETGRGLLLVASLAAHWGVDAAPGGKVVWFDVGSPSTLSTVDDRTAGSLASLPELADAPAAAPPGTAPMIEVQLRSLPVAVVRRASEHSDALFREFRLMLERRPGEGRAIPGQLLALVDEMTTRYAGFTVGAEAELQAAYARGDEWIDLSYRLPDDAGDTIERLDALLDEADAYCQAGAELLTLAAPADTVAVRKWFLYEFVRQSAGKPPQPWPLSPWFSGGMATGDLRFSENRSGSSVTLQLSGDLDVHTAPGLRDRLVGLVAEGAVDLIVDLGEVAFIDSTGIGVLIGGLKRCRARDGDLRLRVPNDELLAVFRATGLDALFVID